MSASLPTLAIKGKLVAPDGDPQKQATLDNYVPYEYILDWYRERDHSVGMRNRVLVLKSMTASGKSTLLPPKIYNMDLGYRGMIVTQPRRLTARENVMTIVENNKNIKLGQNIGWSIKHDKFRPMNIRGILSATIGTFAQELILADDAAIIAKYKHIMIDEIHERSAQLDVTLWMLREFLCRNATREDCPFVTLMSATFDPEPFLRYFDLSLETNFIYCQGETATIIEHWDWLGDHITYNYIETAAKIVNYICRESEDSPHGNDILIFLPGGAEIKAAISELERVNARLHADGKPVFSLLKLDKKVNDAGGRMKQWLSATPLSEQYVIVGVDASNGLTGTRLIPTRRVIAATTVAETGITLPELKYVIDSGFSRETEYNPIYNISGLLTKPAQRSRITQRRGRIGRKYPGEFYPLYPQYLYDILPAQQFPEVVTIDPLTFIMPLVLLSRGLTKTTLDLVDQPSADSVIRAAQTLYSVGYLDEQLALTPLGELGGKITSVSPQASRVILAGYMWGASIVDLVNIVTYATADIHPDHIDWIKVFQLIMPKWGTPSAYYRLRLSLADTMIDGIWFFEAIAAVAESGGSHQLIHYGIDPADAAAFIELRELLIGELLSLDLKVFGTGISLINAGEDLMNEVTRIKHCIYDGYRANLMHTNDDQYFAGKYRVQTPHILAKLSTTDEAKYGFVAITKPRYVIYSGLTLRAYDQRYTVHPKYISVLDGFVST